MKAKDLKNSILQQTVQGKLVPQDPNDEPASVLLDRIREERHKLIAEGKLKAPKGGESIIYRASDGSPYEKRIDTKGHESEPVCIEDEIPFEIPESWEWARLESVTTYIQRGKSPKYSSIEKYPVVSQKCNQWSGFSLDKAKFIDPNTVGSYEQERILCNYDLLWNSTGLGTLGRIAIYDSSKNPFGWAVVDSHVTIIRTSSDWLNYQFAYAYFSSPSVQLVIEDQASGSTKQKELSQETVKNYLIPLPPLSEQERIVAKIDELMPLVDEYGKLEEEREQLDEELPNLLRKSVLQQAVQGKLVPQDPDDEAALVLLDHIREERHKLIAEGKLKAPKGGESVIYRTSDGEHYEKHIDTKGHESEPVCIKDEIPFEIPESWEWVRLTQIVSIQYGFPADSEKFTKDKAIGLIRIRDINSGDLIHTTINYKGKYKNEFIVHAGDDLIGMDGEFRCVRWIGQDSLLNQRVCRLQYYSNFLNCDYIRIVINWYLKEIWKLTSKTTVKHLSAKALDLMLLAIPPLSEQERIVAKFDELMSLIITSQQ